MESLEAVAQEAEADQNGGEDQGTKRTIEQMETAYD